MGHRNTVADTCQAVVKGGASLGVLLAVMVCTGTAAADVCTVPSAPHPTLQAAVDDAYCAEIVLAAQTFVESVVVARDLTLRGASSTSTVGESSSLRRIPVLAASCNRAWLGGLDGLRQTG